MIKEEAIVTLTNRNGLQLQVNPLGASIMALKVPNKRGTLTNVVLGLSEASDYMSEDYLNNCVFLGSSVGRYAGRISNGFFGIDGVRYDIYSENGVSLHGGEEGFDKKLWKIDAVEKGDSSKIELSYFSAHMEEGYPGNLEVKVTYELTQKDELIIKYQAKTDQTTHVNLTNHAYYNLDGGGSILDHILKLNCPRYVEVDKQLIPSGNLKDVANSKYDFLEEKVIGGNQFSGLDDTFVFGDGVNKAEISSDRSGIKMTIETNQPGVVIYTPPRFDQLRFMDGVTYDDYPAICFETQKFPDTPHNAHFPSTLLRPGEDYKNETVLTFTKI